jgi:GntR family histidine utilization transcriptional repressor
MPNPKLPAYEQVKAFVKAQIHSGVWRPGDAVPSEAALQQQFGVSRMTVNRAVKELAAAVRDIHEEVLERGHVHTTQVLLLETTRADVAQAKAFKLRTGAKLFHSVLVHFEDGVAIQLEDRHVNPAAAPGYMELDFRTTTPTHYLLEHAPLTEASYSIEATLPSVQEAKHLGIKRNAPCLVLTRCTVSGPHVASLGRLVYPGMRYSFNGNFQL